MRVTVRPRLHSLAKREGGDPCSGPTHIPEGCRHETRWELLSYRPDVAPTGGRRSSLPPGLVAEAAGSRVVASCLTRLGLSILKIREFVVVRAVALRDLQSRMVLSIFHLLVGLIILNSSSLLNTVSQTQGSHPQAHDPEETSITIGGRSNRRLRHGDRKI